MRSRRTPGWLPPATVPNMSRTLVVQFWESEDGATVYHQHYPIIAWLVTPMEDGSSALTTPVLPNDDVLVTANAVWCFEYEARGPGCWDFIQDRACNKLEDARAHAAKLLKERREDRERREARHQRETASS